MVRAKKAKAIRAKPRQAKAIRAEPRQSNATRAEPSQSALGYIAALSNRDLRIAQVAGDGNCLFRSVSHQIYGDDRFHGLIRENCMDYMELNAHFFSGFVAGEDFSQYLAAKRLDGIWGDNPEIQALSEIYGRPIEIWVADRDAGARKLRIFHDSTSLMGRPLIRLSYDRGVHYDSLVSADQRVLDTVPGVVENMCAMCFSSRANLVSVPTLCAAETDIAPSTITFQLPSLWTSPYLLQSSKPLTSLGQSSMDLSSGIQLPSVGAPPYLLQSSKPLTSLGQSSMDLSSGIQLPSVGAFKLVGHGIQTRRS